MSDLSGRPISAIIGGSFSFPSLCRFFTSSESPIGRRSALKAQMIIARDAAQIYSYTHIWYSDQDVMRMRRSVAALMQGGDLCVFSGSSGDRVG